MSEFYDDRADLAFGTLGITPYNNARTMKTKNESGRTKSDRIADAPSSNPRYQGMSIRDVARTPIKPAQPVSRSDKPK